MPNMDDLITEIYKTETLDIPGSMPSGTRRRIEDKILDEIHSEASQKMVVFQRAPKRKRMVIVLAAALILLLGVTSFAASESEWDITLTNFMGISDSTTLQLESGEVQIDTSSTCNGIEITAVSSIGDKNSAYIRIDTNLTLPEGFDETRDYVLPEDFSYYVSTKPKKSGALASPHSSMTTTFYEDGKLGFLIELSDCENLNKSYVSLTFENLYLYHDLDLKDGDIYKEEELLWEGTWELSWKYSYKSNTKTYRMLKETTYDGNTCYLTKVEVSPISIRLEGFFIEQIDHNTWDPVPYLEAIYFQNGDLVSLENHSTSGLQNGIWLEAFTNVMEFGEPLDVDEIDYLLIGGEKIYL